MAGDDGGQRHGDQAPDEDEPPPWSRSAAWLRAREVGLDFREVAGVDRGVHALDTLLELVEAEASGGGVRRQPVGGFGALAVPDANELSGRPGWMVCGDRHGHAKD
jgi:hypothetical protein